MRIEKHPDDKPLMSSLTDFVMFKENPAWIDIRNWLDDRVEYLKNKLEEADDMETVRGLQEAIKCLKDIRDIPDMFIEELEAEAINKDPQKEEE